MNQWSRLAGSALLSLSITAIAIAQAPALDVRLGLWEVSSETDFGGQVPGLDMSTMTPAQKAALQGMVKGGAKHTSVTQYCMTREKLDKSPLLAMEQEGTTCKQTLTVNTRTALAGTFACTGKMPMSGQMSVDAPSPTGFTATMTSATAAQGKPTTVNIAMTGKWVRADCGNVK